LVKKPADSHQSPEPTVNDIDLRSMEFFHPVRGANAAGNDLQENEGSFAMGVEALGMAEIVQLRDLVFLVASINF
jgi:hypothetical protein